MSEAVDTRSYGERTNGGQLFSGTDMNIFGALTLASGLRLYAKTGMRPNRAYTPTNMLAGAAKYTGKKYRRGEYERAAQDLTEYANTLKALAKNIPDIL